ncbi:6635_t:CDS:2 [Entrophospora sp. SA101]|nr:6635_t:CDS:2 [Entrophospora sp. SA101]
MLDFISKVNSKNVNNNLQFLIGKMKRFAIKNYERVTESKWTLFFLIASIIQAFLAIALEIRILTRNKYANDRFTANSESVNETCTNIIVNRMANIVGENTIFIVFNFFQLWFSYNAIYYQNVIQLLTLAGINYFVGFFAIVQIIEINKWKANAEECKPAYIFQNQFERYEIPLITISLLSATTMAYFTWKLYQQFGWNIYKKIGADLRMQSIYKTMLIFVMLLKLDVFFMIVLAIQACTAFSYKAVDDPKYLDPPVLYWLHVFVTILIVFLQILAFRSVRMQIFIATWIITLADFIMILKFSIKSAREDSWFFFIGYIVSGIVMSLLTFIWGIFVLNNFGLGLKKHMNAELPQHDTNQSPRISTTQTFDSVQIPPISNHSNNNVQATSPTRWAIDDD